MSCYTVPRYKHVQNRPLFLTDTSTHNFSPKSSVIRAARGVPPNFIQGFAAILMAYMNEDMLSQTIQLSVE